MTPRSSPSRGHPWRVFAVLAIVGLLVGMIANTVVSDDASSTVSVQSAVVSAMPDLGAADLADVSSTSGSGLLGLVLAAPALVGIYVASRRTRHTRHRLHPDSSLAGLTFLVLAAGLAVIGFAASGNMVALLAIAATLAAGFCLLNGSSTAAIRFSNMLMLGGCAGTRGGMYNFFDRSGDGSEHDVGSNAPTHQAFTALDDAIGTIHRLLGLTRPKMN